MKDRDARKRVDGLERQVNQIKDWLWDHGYIKHMHDDLRNLSEEMLLLKEHLGIKVVSVAAHKEVVQK